jgi:phenylalanyl-tRNA synthetase beta chain
MKLSAQWIREFVDVPVEDGRLVEDLTSIGIAVEGISGKGGDIIFEMEIGTNRPDAMNHHGVAREVAALYGVPLKPIETSAAEAANPSGKGDRTTESVSFRSELRRGRNSINDFEIDIDDAEGCARYTAQIVRGVNIEASPANIASRLALVDQCSINNAADASNYTLWEMGHPTHAFDLDLLDGGKIIIRRARQGETLKTLDGVDRKLSSEDLVIADAGRPVALAGVMGGFDTMITERTKNILIESAWFDPAAVRRTAKRHGLHTDASHRFERGADYGVTPLACALVAQRITDSGGGTLDGVAIDAIAREIDQAPIVLRTSQVQRILGGSIETHTIIAILKRLGFELIPEPSAHAEFSVRIPTWRLDVEREIDLIEEIARLYGYNKFANTLPAFSGAVVENPRAAKQAKVRPSLLALGYNEAVSLTFISHQDAEAFSSSPVIELANPLNEEASLMRSSLVPGMLNMLAYNLNRGMESVRLFEIGDIYQADGAGTAEHTRICLAATAAAMRRDLPQGEVLERSKSASELDLFRLFKGDIETLLRAFEHKSLCFDSETADYYQPGRSARVLMDGRAIAQFGLLHPEVAGGRKIREQVFIAELFADKLFEHDLRDVRCRPLPRFPAVERDFSFLFPDAVTFGKVEHAIDSLQISELRSFVPVEIFRGGSVAAGQYSMLLRAKFQSLERTLREDEVAAWASKIVDGLNQIGGTQRG